MHSGWYLDKVGGDKVYDIPTATTPPTQEGQEEINQTEAAVKNLVSQMKSNSNQWTMTNDPDRKKYFADKNKELASEISSILGRPVVRGWDGAWYLDKVGGTKLFERYHSGGIVGGLSSLKDDETVSVLKTGELVATSQMKENLYKMITFTKGLAGAAASLPKNTSLENSLKDSPEGLVFNPEISIQIQTDNLDETKLKKYAEQAANTTLNKLKEGFSRFGISSKSSLLLKA